MEAENTWKVGTRRSREQVEGKDTSTAVPRIVALGLAASDKRRRSLCPVFLMLIRMGCRRVGCYLRYHKKTAVCREQINMFPRYLLGHVSKGMAVV